MNKTIRCAQVGDKFKLEKFLDRAGLTSDSIAQNINRFIIMEDESNTIHATLGMELFDDAGMLRSLVITKSVSEHDLCAMFEQILRLAKDLGLSEVFMASNKVGAVQFVKLLGFQQVEKEQLPRLLSQSEHVKHILTLDSHVFLRLLL